MLYPRTERKKGRMQTPWETQHAYRQSQKRLSRGHYSQKLLVTSEGTCCRLMRRLTFI